MQETGATLTNANEINGSGAHQSRGSINIRSFCCYKVAFEHLLPFAGPSSFVAADGTVAATAGIVVAADVDTAVAAVAVTAVA